MDLRRVHVWISGRVQGVCFRAYTRNQAERLNLSGWVRNLPDRRVEAVFQGDSTAVQQMLDWCRLGSPASQVQHLEAVEEPVAAAGERFEIRY